MYKFHKYVSRPITIVISIIFLWVSSNPLVYAEGLKKPVPTLAPQQQQNITKELKATPAEKLENVLNTLEEATQKSDEEKIKGTQKDIKDINKNIEDEFTKTEKFLKDKKISPKILDRHYKFVKEYKEKYNTLKSHITDIKAGRKEKVKDLKAFLKKNKA